MFLKRIVTFVSKFVQGLFGKKFNDNVFVFKEKASIIFSKVFTFFTRFLKEGSSKKRLFLEFSAFLNRKNESSVVVEEAVKEKINVEKKEENMDVIVGRFFSVNDVLRNHRLSSKAKDERVEIPDKKHLLLYKILEIIAAICVCGVIIGFILFLLEPFIIEWWYPDVVVHQVRSKFGKDFISFWSGNLNNGGKFGHCWAGGHWLFSGMVFFKNRRFLRKLRFHYLRRRKGFFKPKKYINAKTHFLLYRKGIGDIYFFVKRRFKILRFKFRRYRSPTKRLFRFKTFLYNYGIWARKLKGRLKLERVYNTYHVYREGFIHRKYYRKQKYYHMTFRAPDNAGYHRACYDNHFQKVLGFPPLFTSPVMKRFLYLYYKFARWFRINREYWGDAIFVVKKAARPPANSPTGIPYLKDFLKMIHFFAPAYNIFYDIFIQPMDNIVKKKFPEYEEDYEDILDDIQEKAILSVLIEGTELVFHRNVYRWIYTWIWFVLTYQLVAMLVTFYHELVEKEIDFDWFDFAELCLFVLVSYNVILVIFYFNYFDDSWIREQFYS